MIKEEYLDILRKNLRNMSEADKDEVIRYYSEYFDEAASYHTAAENLGNPVELAKKVNAESTVGYSDEMYEREKNYSESYGESYSHYSTDDEDDDESYNTGRRKGNRGIIKFILIFMSIIIVLIISVFAIFRTVFINFGFYNFGLGGLDFSVNTTMKTVEYTEMDLPEFEEVKVNVHNCPVYVFPSEDGRYGVDVCLAVSENGSYKIEVKDDVLVIENGTSSINDIFSFNSYNVDQYINIFLPDEEYERIKINTSNANVQITDVYSEEIIVDTSNAHIFGANLKAEKIDLTTSNSDIDVDNIEAENIKLDTSNADITGEDVFGVDGKIDTSNGTIKIENIYFEDKLKADTSNGNIYIVLNGEKGDYEIEADTSNGEVTIDGKDYDDDYKGGSGDAKVVLDSSNGDIVVEFEED